MLAAALRDRRVRWSLGAVAIAVVVLIGGGIATVALVETNTFATVALVFGAVVLLLLMGLMTMLVSFLKDLQLKATQLLEAHPTGHEPDTTRGLLASLKELQLGAHAVRETSLETPIAPPPQEPSQEPVVDRKPSGAPDDPTP